MKRLGIATVCLILLSGCCCRVGPGQMEEDTLCYNHAVQTSTDKQVLLNLVRLRYRDTPAFLDVGVISAAYEIERTSKLPITFDNSIHPSGIDFTKVVPEIGCSYNEKPTTTYSPLTGQRFVTQLLTPISINQIVLLNDMGWRIDRLFRLCVQRINRIRNAPTASGPTPDYTPEYDDYLTLMEAFYHLEQNDAIHLLPRNNPVSGAVEPVIYLDSKRGNTEMLAKVWQLLKLNEGTEIVRLVPNNANPRQGDELYLDTRSPLGILYFLSHAVRVPEAHENCHWVTATDDRGEIFEWNRVLGGLMNIRCGAPRQNPAVIVQYRGIPFYIGDSDLESKSTFSLLSQLLALQFGEAQLPILTLPIASN